MFQLKDDNPFASPQPFASSNEVPLHDEEHGLSSNGNVPSALGASSSAWGAAGAGVGSSAQVNGGSKDLISWEAELKAKEEALKKLESVVAAAESRLGHKNWPRCRPILRHAIGEDIPEPRRGLVRRGYLAWILAAAGFLVDWITITIMFIAGHKGLSDWLFCTLISGFGLPLSFLLWHMSLYRASMTDGACKWTWFFLFSAMHVGLSGWTFAGPPIVGKWAAGLFTMIDQFKAGNGASIFFGVCCVITMALWALTGVLGFSTWCEGYHIFRSKPLERPAPEPSSRWGLPKMPSMPGFGGGGRKGGKLPLHVAMAGLDNAPPRG